MKTFKTLLTIWFIAATATTTTFAANIKINSTNFPDREFYLYVYHLFDGKDIVTEDEIAEITTIDVNYSRMTGLRGIEYFTGLKKLDFENRGIDVNLMNKITSVDLSKNTELEELYCSGSKLTSLDLSKNTKLKVLHCNFTELTSIDLSKNTELEKLNCYNAKLTSLDVSKNTKLKELYCESNQLVSLDISANTELKEFCCYNNYIPEKNLPTENTDATYWSTFPQHILAIFMNGEEEHDTQKITTTSGTITKPVDPTKSGYVFNSWYKDTELTTPWIFGTDEFTGITTLYAGFTMEYTIAGTANNDDFGTVTGAETYAYGTTATLTATPSEGYLFVNWTEDNVEVSTDAEYSFQVTTDRELVANFQSSTTTGIDDVETKNLTSSIQIFPNPTTGKVFVRGLSVEKRLITPLRLFTMQGTLLQQTQGSEMNISGYANGIYLIEINGKTTRIIKQ